MVTGIARLRHDDPEKGAPQVRSEQIHRREHRAKTMAQSGALVVEDVQGWETNNGYLRGCTQTVTIVFDAKHKGSVQHVTGKKVKEY